MSKEPAYLILTTTKPHTKAVPAILVMNPMQDFNLGSRKEWLRNWTRHQANLASSTSRLDDKRPESFTPAFHTLRSQAFQKQRISYTESRRSVQQENEALAERLTRVAADLPGQGTLRRAPVLSQQQRDDDIRQENQRLLHRIISIQPALSARQLQEDFQLTRLFQQLRQRPILSLHAGRLHKRPQVQTHSRHIGLEVVIGKDRRSEGYRDFTAEH